MAESSKATIERFKTTKCFLQAKARLRTYILRDPGISLSCMDQECLQADILEKKFEAHSDVQVINILGYAMNKTFAKSVQVEDLMKQMRDGNACLFEGNERKMLEKLVSKMPCYQFTLIPLVLVKQSDMDREDKMLDSLLIKVHQGSSYTYVDISGRVYKSFGGFLEENTFPLSIICYPTGGEISLRGGDLVMDCALIGKKNAALNIIDVVVGVVGAVGTIGAMSATGGLAVPFLAAYIGGAAYGTGRGINKLMDASQHGSTLNPFEDAEARNNWLMLSTNLLAFASVGVKAGVSIAAKTELLAATNTERLIKAGRMIHKLSAGVSAVTIVDTVIYAAGNWSELCIEKKIALACAVCFSFKEVISFVNAELLIRRCELNGIYKFFQPRIEPSLEPRTTTVSFASSTAKMFDNDFMLHAGVKLVRELVRDNISITVNEEFTKIKFIGFEYEMRTILGMKHEDIAKLLYMIQGISCSFADLFSLLRMLFGDKPIMCTVFKHADQIGGNRASYGQAVNELLQVFDIIKRVASDISILTETGLIIGSGHAFTIGSAFKVLIKMCGFKAVSLLKALTEMNPREAKQLNAIRSQWGSREYSLFDWIITDSVDCGDMLSKIRFILRVHDICTEKSLRITELFPKEGTIEIESKMRISPEEFSSASHSTSLIDPIFFRMCEPAMCCHREYLESVWKYTCIADEPLDKCFEKLVALENAFQRYPFSVENAVAYASTMRCADLPTFSYHALFALHNLEKLMRDTSLDEAAANEVLFADNSMLQSRFTELEMKAQELVLGGYCAVDDDQLDDHVRLLEVVKTLASNAALRFGAIENAVLHLDKHPLLRLGSSELKKYNRFIANKKFMHEEARSLGENYQKWLVYLSNDQLQIVIGVVRGLGAYIDTFLFSC